ncbi:Translation initiation factor IF-2 [Rosistilla carotiformis]|uniref:Translation initiation factor IF-2 n=1 Tax=Rosistilla carotiformis TaxID=2528017 RepID=A0A518JMA8_9BACT|nr:translation initiation factor IF-2 [Rosistilla carotiformis]QDV66681.1 Translation initiation factor IF-2 [Rosistilla carotiformis]
MAVRIYALAKDLKIDSKELVQICNKVGVTGKGSALASLDDDEVEKVKKHLSQLGAPKVEKVAIKEDVRPVRGAGPLGTAIKKAGPPAVLKSRPKSASEVEVEDTPASDVKESPAIAATQVPVEAPKASVEVAEEPVAPVKPAAAVSPPAEPPAAPREPVVMEPNKPVQPAANAPLRREAILGGASSRIRDIGGRGRSGGNRPSGGSEGGDRSGGGKKRGPVINLAAVPKSPTRQPRPAAGEAPAQKPEIRLSKDVIQGHKQGQGMKASLEKLVQDDVDSKKADSGKGKVGGALSSFTGTGNERGRAGKAADLEEERTKKKGIAGMASARADRNKGRRGGRRDIERSFSHGDDRRRRRTITRTGKNTAAPRKENVVLELPCSIRSFSEAAGISAAQVLKTLMGMGMMMNINAQIDQGTAELIAAELDLEISLKSQTSLEEDLIDQIEERADEEADLVPRQPIVTFLGHVDHGKTSLLDYLIGTRIVKGEAGGITQHIRAYEVDKDGRKITFVDTPGHEAFTEMRARGANVTDIAVLVIAADDGIMPQTEEAISHAKAAGVPIVVALNKMDIPGVDSNRPMTQMTEHGLTPSEWGGDVEVVRTSATTGLGMDELLDTLLTVSELNEYKANPNRDALGVCLESEQQADRGVIAKFVVQNGTLKVGDVVVCGPAHGRVKALTDTLTGEPMREAGPSTPVNVTGLDQPPGAGDRFHVLDNIAEAREIAETREFDSKSQNLSGITTKVSFEHFQQLLQDGKLGKSEDRAKLNLIIRADMKGSLEAIDKEIAKFDHPEVEIRVLQRSVGGITVADVTLASASDAVILGFNVIPDEAARSMVDDRKVEIRRYDVIYKMTDDLKAMIEGRLKPEERVVELGRAVVKQVFSISRVGVVAGSYVAQGSIERGCRIRVNRDGRTIGDYPLDSIRRHKEDVKEVPRGMECGIRLSGFNDIKQDDVLEAYRIEEFARTLD